MSKLRSCALVVVLVVVKRARRVSRVDVWSFHGYRILLHSRTIQACILFLCVSKSRISCKSASCPQSLGQLASTTAGPYPHGLEGHSPPLLHMTAYDWATDPGGGCIPKNSSKSECGAAGTNLLSVSGESDSRQANVSGFSCAIGPTL